jgi:hypothetical protein
MEQVKIQYQTEQGWWITVQTTFNESQNILTVVRSVKTSYPDKRIRAVDMNDRVVDIFN